MPASRFILRYRGAGSAPSGDIERIRALPDTHVLDASARMLLVEAPADTLASLIDSLPDWVLTEERTIPLPDSRQKVRRAPGDG